MRLAAEQEAGKQAAAVMAELQGSQAALTKLGRVAAAQQQQIEAVQVPARCRTLPRDCLQRMCTLSLVSQLTS